MAIPKPIFGGKIDGKGIQDYCKLDKHIVDVQDRIDYVKDVLNVVDENGKEFTNDRFLIDIWDTGVCKSELGMSDFLWSQTNVASVLEMLGSYILYADEEKNLRKQTQYKIYYDEHEFDKAIKKDEELVNNRSREVYNNNNGKNLKILIPHDNYKLAPKEKITNVDLYRYPIIKQYHDFCEYLKVLRDNDDIRNEMNEQKNTHITEKRLRKLIGFLNVDMVDVKMHYHPHLKPKHLLKDDGYPSWEEFDEFDVEHMKALLQVHRDMELVDFQNDVTCLVYDLNNALKKLKLTDSQRNILNLWQSCMTQKEIGDAIGKSHQYVSKVLNNIVLKIINVYMKDYEDWYYLNIAKGTYKTCSTCGEVKLISEFTKNSKEHDVYKPECKECRNKRRIKIQ